VQKAHGIGERLLRPGNPSRERHPAAQVLRLGAPAQVREQPLTIGADRLAGNTKV
jgi:hypothetical protein